MYLTQSLHRALQQHPTRTATVFGKRSQTFAQLVDRVARLAGGLASIGVGSGDRVAMLALNSDRYLEYLSAVSWAGAVIVPVNYRWSVPEIAHSLLDCDARVLLVDAEFVPLIPELRRIATNLRTIIYLGDHPNSDYLNYEEIIQQATPIPDARRCGESLAAIFYTGGTTGRSKGVMLSHNNLMTSALGGAVSGYWATPTGRYLHSAPMFHLADLCLWLSHSVVDSTHIVIPRFEPLGVLEATEQHQVTDWFLVPTMIQMVVDHPQVRDFDLSSLRRLVYGASPISEGLLNRTMTLFPRLELTQAYGMTELAPMATLLGPPDHRRADRSKLRSAGRATPHSEIRVVSPNGETLGPGEVGEVTCRGGHVMMGYWDQPEVTAQAVKDGWMHTGDGGYLDEEGYLYIVDRIKDMIVSGGENVYSAEVENALSTHPGVAASAVIGVPDPTYGERVHAVIVASSQPPPTELDLRDHVKSLISGYKAPRSFEFVAELPKSPAGKVLKRELRAQHWAPADRDVS